MENKIADGRIRTADVCYCNRQLCQLSHSDSPRVNVISNVKDLINFPLPTYTIDQNQRPGYTSNYLINKYLHFGLSENSKSSIKTEEFYRHFLVIKSILHRLKKFEF